MEQDEPEITELKEIEEDFKRFRTIQLNYRYKTNEPPELPEDFPIKSGRDREIYSCIIRTAMHIGIEHDDIIEYIQNVRKEKQEEMQDTREYLILKAIRDLQCNPTLGDAPEEISYADIAEYLGWEPEKRQKMGYVFKKKLMLKTKRKTKGSVVLLNDEKNIRKLKSLNRRYKL